MSVAEIVAIVNSPLMYADRAFVHCIERAIKRAKLPPVPGYPQAGGGIDIRPYKATDAAGSLDRRVYYFGTPDPSNGPMAMIGREPDSIVATLYAIGDKKTSIYLECKDAAWLPFFDALLGALAVQFPEDGATPPLAAAKEVKETPASGRDAEPRQAAPTDGSEDEERGPWNAVPAGWQQEAVKLWWQGFDKGEIANRLKYGRHAIETKFSELRRILGKDVVPYAKDPRRGRKT